MIFAERRNCFLTLHLLAVSVASLCCAAGYAQASAPAKDANDPAKNPAKNPKIGALIETLQKTRTPASAAISPDGMTVAWTLRGKGSSEIHLTQVANTVEDKVVTTGPAHTDCESSDPKWSPNGESLAFISGCNAVSTTVNQEQVFLWSKTTGTSKQLTHLTGGIDSLAWSPDGKTIAFLFVENATRSAGALAAMKPSAGVIGEDGVEIQRVGAVNVSSRQMAFVTPETLHVYEFDWAPNSRELAIVAAAPPGENNWWVAQLYVEPVLRDGQGRTTDNRGLRGTMEMPPKSILDTATISGPLHGLQIAVPRWSPDGKQIAFIGGLMSDQGATGGDVYLIPAAGGEPKNVTPSRDASIAYLAWLNDTKIGVAEHVGGSSHLTVLDLKSGADGALKNVTDVTFPETIGSGALTMSVSAARNGDVALIRSSFEKAPEVWAGPENNLKQITHLNDGLKPAWGKTENIEWSNGGFKVQGWLLYPADYDPAKKYPLLISVHGGPSSAVTPRWPGVGYGGVPFSALGYFVFMPNPRGSYGQGEKFTQANVKDFGYGDLHDILAGMDVLEQRLPIDKNREGLTGWSYGGFMTMFAVTQTTRFKAAVAGAGISDWQSYYGENSIDQWMTPFFGKSVYEDPAVYAKSSAIDYIKQVKTPTLVVVGDRDGECPAPQSFEFWHALRAEGVKTQLVVYPNEGHAFRDPVHRRDVLERALNWFETEMPAQY